MAVRNATVDDLDEIIHLARGDRLMRAGWDDRAWAQVPDAAARHDLWIRRLLGDPGALSLVSSDSSGRLAGVLLARPVAVSDRDPGGTWVVEEFFVASLLMWPTVGRALLGAASASLRRWGGTALAIGAPPHDRALASVIAEAGLVPSLRYRLRTLGNPVATMAASTRLPAPAATPSGLAHSLSTSPAVGSPVWCAFGGAQTLLRCRRWLQRGALVVGVSDPMISSGFVDVDLVVIELVERHLMTIGVATSVVVSPGHGVTSLDVALDQLGYSHCMDWWSTAPIRRPMLASGTRGQLSA